MPIIVSCPTCSGQLRVADDLIGRRVRCPTCQGVFEAAEPAPAPPPAPDTPPPAPAPKPAGHDTPVETVPIKPLFSLSLDPVEDKPAPRPQPLPPVPRLGPVGAVEVGGNGEPPPEAPPRAPSRRPRLDDDPRDLRRPRLSDDHDDTRPCPHCGRMLHRDDRRCYGCGTAQDYDEDQRRDRGGGGRFGTRRDCEPHRAGTVLTMGILGLVMTFILPPIGLVLGLVGWVMGQGDLRKMRAGTMDPEGEGSTRAGWVCGIIGTALGGLITLSCGGCIGLVQYQAIQASKQRQKFQVAPPPPKAAPPAPKVF